MKKKIHISIVGLGHIGGSLAASLKKNYGSKISIVGIDKNRSVLNKAKSSKLFDEVATLKKSQQVINSEIVFISSGIQSIPELFLQLGKINFKEKIIVTDVGSVKTEIFTAALKLLPETIDFVGAHPIAGTEKIGFDNLVEGLFKDKPVFISGTRASKKSINFISDLWKSLGANVFFVSPEKHDKIFALLSHMPHVLAFGLKSTTNKKLSVKEIVKYGGTSYKDYSRISKSSDDLWSEIFLSNRKNLISGIKDFKKFLDKLEKALKTSSKDNVKKHLKS